MKNACIGADFDTNAGCDACVTAFVQTVLNKPRFSGADDERKSGGTFAGLIPTKAILTQIDF